MSRAVSLALLLAALAALAIGLVWLATAPAAGSDAPATCDDRSFAGSTHTSGGGALMLGVDLRELSARSTRIVAGKVESFQTCLDLATGAPVTSVTVAVSDHLKALAGAAASPDEISFDVAGGRLGNIVMAVGTNPEFAVGEQTVVFLRRVEGGGLQLTAGFQGKFVVHDSKVDRAGLSLDGFAKNVRAAVAGQLPAADDPLAANAGGIVEVAYALNDFKWYTQPINYYLNPGSSMPGHLDANAVRTAWSNAFAAWENDPKSDVDFASQGDTGRTSNQDPCNGAQVGDGYNDVTWGTSTDLGSATLATTRSCAYADVFPFDLTDADIEFDINYNAASWRTNGSGACGSGQHDIEAVALHEIGHLLGLGHPGITYNCPGSLCPIMNSSYVGVQHAPCQDDADGVALLYPAGTPAPTSTSTNTRTPTATRTATATSAPNTPTATSTATATSTTVVTDTPTMTFTPAVTDTATPTPTATATSAPLATATATSVPATSTSTPTRTATATPTRTSTRTVTPTRTRTPTPSKPLGDVNDDGIVNSIDSLLILQYSAGLTHTLPNLTSADVNGNGQVDSIDSALVLQYSAGLLDVFPSGRNAGLTIGAIWLARLRS